jgi:hypothetical protein
MWKWNISKSETEYLNIGSFCLSLLSARITGVYLYASQNPYNKTKLWV